MARACVREGAEAEDMGSKRLMLTLWARARSGHLVLRVMKSYWNFNHISLATVL